MHHNSEFISIIVPTYNSEKTLLTTVSSIVLQTFTNFEILIIDDGSIDNTKSIITNYEDSRIQYIYQENAERAVARNLGISLAKGNLIAFLDSDDIWMPNKLLKQVHLMLSNPDLGLVYSDLIYFNDRTDDNLFLFSNKVPLYRGRVPVQRIITQNFIQSPTPLIRKSVFDHVGLFDSDLIPVEDWDMWIRIVENYPIDYVDEPLARYRVSENVILWNKHPENHYNATIKMLNKIEHGLSFQNYPILKGTAKCRSTATYNYSISLFLEQKYFKAIKLFFKLAGLIPSYFKAFLLYFIHKDDSEFSSQNVNRKSWN